ncbi:MAG: helix-turn-helix transcriptional regulator [Bacillota bacterium]
MRVNRLLSMLLIISNRGKVTGQELSEHFEVSLRTIYRDIDKICEAGVPIVSIGGTGGGYSMMEGYNVDNLFFNKKEASALMAVVDNLKVLFGRNHQFNDIVAKFEKLSDKEDIDKNRLMINMSHFSFEEELKEYLSTMSSAIEESRLLVFRYINRRLEDEWRTVEPSYISFSSGEWNLVGFCRSRNAYRRFKLVRIRELKLGEAYAKSGLSREDIQKIFKEEYFRKSIRVVLGFSRKFGPQLKEYFMEKDIEVCEDGDYTATDYFPNDEGLIRFILSFGKDCEVLEPDFLREEVKFYIDEMLKKYDLKGT